MKTFKPTFKDKKTGRKKKCAHWYLTFVDNRQIRRRLPAYSDKKATDNLGIQIQKLLDANGVLDRDLQAWFAGLVLGVRDKLTEWHMVQNDNVLRDTDKTLAEHISDFYAALLVKETGLSHAVSVKTQLEKMVSYCGFQKVTDIQAQAVYRYLGERRRNGKISQRSFNAYLGFAKHFCGWLKKQRRVIDNVLEDLEPLTITKKTRVRRAIKLEELVKLLTATEQAPERFGMSGHERQLLYRTACHTGLRANELRTLTVGDLDFENLTVTVRASCAKNKKRKALPLKPTTAAMLQEHVRGKLPNVRVFGGRYRELTHRTADMLKLDLAEADIDYIDDRGRVFDFHSLRVQAGTLMKQGGVAMKDAQSILRHSNIELTANIYTDVFTDDEVAAVEKMPDITIRTNERGLSCA